MIKKYVKNYTPLSFLNFLFNQIKKHRHILIKKKKKSFGAQNRSAAVIKWVNSVVIWALDY